MNVRIAVQEADFDPAQLQAELTEGTAAIGAIASFVGLVRSSPEEPVTRVFMNLWP